MKFARNLSVQKWKMNKTSLGLPCHREVRKLIKSQHPQNIVQKTKLNLPWWTVLALGMTAPRGTMGKRHGPLDPDNRKPPLTAIEAIHTQYLLVYEISKVLLNFHTTRELQCSWCCNFNSAKLMEEQIFLNGNKSKEPTIQIQETTYLKFCHTCANQAPITNHPFAMSTLVRFCLRLAHRCDACVWRKWRML
jgi:hypothetical protein